MYTEYTHSTTPLIITIPITHFDTIMVKKESQTCQIIEDKSNHNVAQSKNHWWTEITFTLGRNVSYVSNALGSRLFPVVGRLAGR